MEKCLLFRVDYFNYVFCVILDKCVILNMYIGIDYWYCFFECLLEVSLSYFNRSRKGNFIVNFWYNLRVNL